MNTKRDKGETVEIKNQLPKWRPPVLIKNIRNGKECACEWAIACIESWEIAPYQLKGYLHFIKNVWTSYTMKCSKCSHKAYILFQHSIRTIFLWFFSNSTKEISHFSSIALKFYAIEFESSTIRIVSYLEICIQTHTYAWNSCLREQIFKFQLYPLHGCSTFNSLCILFFVLVSFSSLSRCCCVFKCIIFTQ